MVDQSVVVTIVKWLRADPQFPPTLWMVQGPNNAFFGYIYTSAQLQVAVKVVDNDTLFVEDIPLPPFDYGPGGRA